MAFLSQTNSNIVCMVIRCQESNAFSTLGERGKGEIVIKLVNPLKSPICGEISLLHPANHHCAFLLKLAKRTHKKLHDPSSLNHSTSNEYSINTNTHHLHFLIFPSFHSSIFQNHLKMSHQIVRKKLSISSRKN